MWANWVNIILGLWMIIAAFIPSIVSKKTPSMWNDIIIGIIIAIVAYIAATAKKPICWINVIMGVWLIIAGFIPSIVSKKTGNLWNDLIVGIIVLIVAGIAAFQKSS